MRKKIKAVLKSDMIKVSSKNGAATAFRLASGFVVSKVLAIFVGPSGLAILGQMSNITNIFQTISTGGITIGITKYIAEYADDKIRQQKIILNALVITFICSAFCSAFILIFYKYINRVIFAKQNYESIVLILGATILVFSFNSVIAAVLNGLKNFKLYIRINIISSVLTLISTLTLVYFFHLYGALLSLIAVPSALFFISWYLVRNEPWATKDFFFKRPDLKILKLFGKFSLMAINNAVVGAVAQIVVRNFLTKNMSLDVAGIWDGMNRLSSAYLILLTTSIQIYYLPALSYIKDRKLLWREIMKTEKIILPLALIGFLLIYFFRGVIIDILFSPKFYLMKSVIGLQLIGDLIKVGSWIMAYTFYAKAMTKQLILTDNIFTTTYVIIAYLFLMHTNLGLHAVYVAYIINNVIACSTNFYIMKRYTSNTNYE